MRGGSAHWQKRAGSANARTAGPPRRGHAVPAPAAAGGGGPSPSVNHREHGEIIVTKRYDVAILGSGIGGSMLACILARHGVSTLLLEGASHPRFTIGESLIPETGIRLRIIGEKYGVPEIGWIGSFHV